MSDDGLIRKIEGSLVKLKGNYIYIIYYVSFNIQRGFSQAIDKIEGSSVKLKGNYIYIYIIYYVSFNIQRGFSQLGDSCSNVIRGQSVKLDDL